VQEQSEKHWLERFEVAEHEATHAVVAQKMGLPVSWVTIDPGCDEGLNFDAAVKIPDELIDRENPDTLRAICVAMAAPFHLRSHLERPIGHYTVLEYQLALGIAEVAGIDAKDIHDTSARLFRESYDEIIELAERLREEGTVTFEEVVS
jgi:hypothetical protein